MYLLFSCRFCAPKQANSDLQGVNVRVMLGHLNHPKRRTMSEIVTCEPLHEPPIGHVRHVQSYLFGDVLLRYKVSSLHAVIQSGNIHASLFAVEKYPSAHLQSDGVVDPS